MMPYHCASWAVRLLVSLRQASWSRAEELFDDFWKTFGGGRPWRSYSEIFLCHAAERDGPRGLLPRNCRRVCAAGSGHDAIPLSELGPAVRLLVSLRRASWPSTMRLPASLRGRAEACTCRRVSTRPCRRLSSARGGGEGPSRGRSEELLQRTVGGGGLCW